MNLTDFLKSLKTATVLLTLGLAIAGAAEAREDFDKLIGALEAGGTLTPEQAKELRADVLPAVRSDSSAISEVEIRGRIQTQFGYVEAKNDDIRESFDTFEVRRVRMGLSGNLYSDFRAQLEADMKPGEGVSMTAAFLQWREYKPAYVKMGYDKPHSSLEEGTSSTETLTIERSLINDHVAAPGRLNGLALDGEIGMFSYGLGIYTDTENRNKKGEEPKYMQNLMVGVEIDEWLTNSELRVQASHMASDDPNGEIGEELGQRNVVGLAYRNGSFGFQTEYFLATDDKNDGSINGWYVMPSLFVTEANQLVLRYEQAQSEDEEGLEAPSRYTQDVPEITEEGDNYQSTYLGWNHFLIGHDHKLMAGIELATMKDTAAGDLNTTSFYAAWRMQF